MPLGVLVYKAFQPLDYLKLWLGYDRLKYSRVD
nr:MAG TPA: hypothetical protein [Caudoviricetes sp.]